MQRLSLKIDYQKAVSYTHLRAHETCADLVCRLLLEKKYLSSFSTLNNNSAVATIIIVGNKFLNKVNNLSENLTNNQNTTSNYSNWDNKLIVRLLSKDSYNLKFAIDKILSYFFEGSKIPKVWNI